MDLITVKTGSNIWHLSTDAGSIGTRCVSYNCNAVYIQQILGVGIHKESGVTSQQDDTLIRAQASNCIID